MTGFPRQTFLPLENAESMCISEKDFWDFGNTEKPNRSSVNKYKLICMDKEPKLLPTKWVLGCIKQSTVTDIFWSNQADWHHHSKEGRKALKRVLSEKQRHGISEPKIM